MIKYFCDRCGKEAKHGRKCVQGGRDLIHMCDTCYALLDSIKDKINIYVTSEVEKFCNMTEEEIELLRYTFKVGDEVITSTGEVGTITSICTCDRCKERGFFEPEVETEIGNSTIWVTDNDKRVGFRSFYKIGNRTFGNIDEDCVVRSIANTNSRIIELEEDLKQYNMQLDVIEHIKNGKRLWWED